MSSHGADAGTVIADAIKVAEDSVPAGNLPEIETELLVAAPVPTLIDLSKEARMMVVGCRGQDVAHAARIPVIVARQR
jgi:nucleotide-binding universal stress UspA family protein